MLLRFILLVLLITPASLVAQEIRGELREEESGRPVSGALVVLLDGGGTVRQGSLTDQAGRFRLRAPTVGQFSIRAEHLGYRTVTRALVLLMAESAESLILFTRPEPIELAGLEVVAERRCRVRPGRGLAAHTLWEQAQKALFSAAVLQDQQLIEYEVRTYERDFSLQRGRSRTLNSSVQTVRGRPFSTASAEDLVEHGFIRADGDGLVFYGPDAQVLLSDAFLNDYCWYVQRDRDRRESVVGLAFEPVQRASPGIQGVLWLDARTGALQYLEYHYTNVPGRGPEDLTGGRIEFARIPEGGWIVQRWWIRTTQVARGAGGGGQGEHRPFLAGYVEAGGEVKRVTWLESQ